MAVNIIKICISNRTLTISPFLKKIQVYFIRSITLTNLKCLFNLIRASITLFRSIIYAIPQGLHYATKIKINSKYWLNTNIQVLLDESHLIISFLFDIYVFFIMIINDNIFKFLNCRWITKLSEYHHSVKESMN